MNHIVLLGNSIFDNAAYAAGGPDVVRQLRDILPSGWRATLNALDGAVIADLPQQLQKLPGDASHLVVSVGGNDALGDAGLLDRRMVPSRTTTAPDRPRAQPDRAAPWPVRGTQPWFSRPVGPAGLTPPLTAPRLPTRPRSSKANQEPKAPGAGGDLADAHSWADPHVTSLSPQTCGRGRRSPLNRRAPPLPSRKYRNHRPFLTLKLRGTSPLVARVLSCDRERRKFECHQRQEVPMQITAFKDMYIAELQELASVEDQLADALFTMSEWPHTQPSSAPLSAIARTRLLKGNN